MDFLCSREKAHILSQVKVLHAVASPLPQLIHTRDPAPGFSSSLEFPDIADTPCVFQFCALDAPPVSVCLISSQLTGIYYLIVSSDQSLLTVKQVLSVCSCFGTCMHLCH